LHKAQSKKQLVSTALEKTRWHVALASVYDF